MDVSRVEENEKNVLNGSGKWFRKQGSIKYPWPQWSSKTIVAKAREREAGASGVVQNYRATIQLYIVLCWTVVSLQ